MNKIKKMFLPIILVFILALSLTGCNIGSEASGEENNASNESREKNAYEIAVDEGFTGSLNEWLLSLVNTSSYASVYDLAKDNGIFDGTLEEFIASLKGEAGVSSTEEAAAYSVNSVVSVWCSFTTTVTYRDWWSGRTQTQSQESTSAGAGVIIGGDKENGVAYIVTNYHVVYYSDADSPVSNDISIYLYGMEYTSLKIDATYIGGSMNYDIAVLKIVSDTYKESGAYPATIGDSSDLSVGSQVLAIGNPEAEGISVTSGIISVPVEKITMTAADETTKIDFRVIRIDAAVNSGNSGGGLFNSKGELIGIVNAKSVDEEIEGMCYAIPVNIASAVAEKIINTCDGDSVTTIRTVSLGATFAVESSKSVYDSLTKTNSIIQTIVVDEISSSGCAKNILKAGDTVINVTYNGVTYPVKNLYSIEDVLLKVSKGDSADFYVLRNGNYETVTITFTVDSSVA